jgi:hypothetical protein
MAHAAHLDDVAEQLPADSRDDRVRDEVVSAACQWLRYSWCMPAPSSTVSTVSSIPKV